MHSGCTLQKNKLNPFHGLMLLPKPYGVERKVLVFAKVKSCYGNRLQYFLYRQQYFIVKLYTTTAVHP